MKAQRLGLLATVVSLSATSWAGAQTVYNWDPPAHANVFSTATNWTPTGPPGSTGEARFNTSASAYTVSFNTDPTNARVRVGNDHVTFDLNGHTYTLTTTATSSPSIMVGGITLVDDALLTIRDGTLTGQHAVIAPATLQTAAGMVVDVGATLNLAGTFTVGKQRPGSLTIQSGGDVLSATGVLGESGAGDGSVTVTGNGSTWTNSGNVYVGGQAAIDGGNGTLSITNQGFVDVGGTLKLWPGGTVALGGGTLETASLELAGGSFNWTSGTLHLGSDLSVEPSGPLGGSVTVDVGKVLETDGDLYVGNTGSGTVNVTGGGQLSNDVAHIGNQVGSKGEVTVEGADSIWITSQGLYIGDNGELTVSKGAEILSGDAVITGHATLDGNASWNTGAVGLRSNGVLEITGSYLESEQGYLQGSVVVDNSTWAVIDNGSAAFGSLVEIYDDATLEIVNHGVIYVTANVFTIPDPNLSLYGGTLRIIGDSSLVSEAYSYIQSRLEIADGGFFESRLGIQINGGFVTVDGSDSALQTLDTLVIKGMGDDVLVVTGSAEVSSGRGVIQGGAHVSIDGPDSVWLSGDVEIFGGGRLTLKNSGSVQATTIDVDVSGAILGDGTIIGYVENSGLVSPGTTPGALNIDGSYIQTFAGELLIELAVLSYDQLLVTGEATLAGTLTVNLIDGFTPSVGQSFTVITADNINGTFATEMLPSVPNLAFDVIYNAQSVVLSVVSALPGDYNGDGNVDAADYVVWRKNDGTQMGYDTWRAHFGATAGSGAGATGSASAAVPEPASLALFLLASLTLTPILAPPRRV